jgi:hypothetical protein
MGVTTQKGELGEAMVLADLQRKGYGVALPFGHDVPFDMILIRRTTGALERVQCKYTESDGQALDVRCGSTQPGSATPMRLSRRTGSPSTT